MKLVPSLLVVAVLSLAFLAGCGSSSSSSASSSSTSASSPAEAETETADGAERAAYVKEADAVCRATDEVTETLDEELGALIRSGISENPAGDAKLGELLARVVFIGREEGQELASIEPPATDSATIMRWIETGQEGLDDLEAATAALEEGSTAKFGSLYGQGLATLRRARGIAQSYGFEVCGTAARIVGRRL